MNRGAKSDTALGDGDRRRSEQKPSIRTEATKDSGPTNGNSQEAKFQKILVPYQSTRDWIIKQLDLYEADVAIQDHEIRKARNELFLLTAKAIRGDPKLMKTKYDDVFWRTAIYPLIRGIADNPQLMTAKLQLASREHIACGHAAFRTFIEVLLVRLEFKITNVPDIARLPYACESCSDKKYKPEQIAWIRSFLSRCLCCIGDLYRYSYKFNHKSLISASFYYELAAFTRPSDGRAVSCLGIVQKELGEPFSATYYFLLSACKKNKYGFYLKNLESLQGPVDDLSQQYNVSDGRPHKDDDPRETIKKFSIHVLHIVYSLLLKEEMDAEKVRNCFTVALEFLSATLQNNVPDAGQWRTEHYSTTTYLHPNLLWKIYLMVIEVFYLKKNEVDGFRRGNNLSSLCAFIVTMIGKITAGVEQSLRYWLSYTNFNLVPEPNPESVVCELQRQQKAAAAKIRSSDLKSAAVAYANVTENIDGVDSLDSLLGSLRDDRPDSNQKQADISADFESVEGFWQNFARKHHTVDCEVPECEPGKESLPLSPQSSYVQALMGFIETQMHLALVHLIFQSIRCDEEIWSFCLVNFPDIICDLVDIVNLLSIPKFVGIFIKEQKMELFPLEEELLLRDTVTLDKWVSRLDWKGYHHHGTRLTKTENALILISRFSEMASDLQKSNLATYDAHRRKWVCTLQRKNLGMQDTTAKVDRRLMLAQKLGKAWMADQDMEREQEFMTRRADLPKYLVIDTSCLLRKLGWIQRLYDSRMFKIVVPSYVLEELDRGKKNKVYRDVIRWLDATTAEVKGSTRMEIQKLKDMHRFDLDLKNDWDHLTTSERSVRVMVDCAKFFAQEVKRQTDDSPDYGLHIRVLTDLDLQSVYCARVIEQMERLEMPHEIKLMRIHDFMGWFDEGPQYFRRLQEQEGFHNSS